MHKLLDNRNFLGLAFMLPAAALLLAFLTYPLGLGLWLGFTDARIGRAGQWIGIENFQSLFDEGRGYAFPCDEIGRVDIDGLSHRLRLNYLYVRTLIGRDFSMPAVIPSTLH